MKSKDKKNIIEKISNLKLQINELINRIEAERRESNEEEVIIVQQMEEEKDFLIDQIKDLKEALSIINTSSYKNKTYTLNCNGRSKEVTIVLPALTDPLRGFISMDSPLALALKNRKSGEEVSISTPVGVQEYKILKIN